jgi:hypothetical protein
MATTSGDRLSSRRWWLADATALERSLAVAAVSWATFLVLTDPVVPNDFWWHLALGRLIVQQGHVPLVDAFSFTRNGFPWQDQSWLAQVIFYWIHQLANLAGVVVLNAAMIALAYLMLLGVCVWRSKDIGLSAALLVLVVVPITMDNWTVRPQSLTFPLFVGCLSVLEAHRAGRRARLFLLPVLTVVWVNVHGSFPLALVLIALAAAGLLADSVAPGTFGLPPQERVLARGRARQLLPWAALAGCVVLVNPRGTGALTYVSALLHNDVVTQLASEWAPPTVRDASGAAFFIVVIACGILGACLPRRPRPSDIVMLVPFLWVALGAGRNVIWFAFVAAPMLAEAVSRLAGSGPRDHAARPERGAKVVAAIVSVASVVVLLAGSPWFKARWLPGERARLVTSDTPVRAVEFLRSHQPRPHRLFHSIGYGSYLVWAAPDQPVFVDPRLELYPRRQWNDYIALNDGHDVDSLIAKYDFDGFLLDLRRQKPLVDALRARPSAWVERYRDEATVYISAAQYPRQVTSAGLRDCCLGEDW